MVAVGVRVAVALVALLAAGCSRGLGPMEQVPAGLRSLPGAEPAYLVLGDGRVLLAADSRVPREPYLVGVRLPDGTFRTEVPPRILGVRRREVPFGYVPGWIEIETQRFRRDMEGVAPAPPVVRGWFDADGRFIPGEAALTAP